MLVKLLASPAVSPQYRAHTRTHSRPHTRTRLYSYGEYKAEDQDKMVADLDKKVMEVYASCIGANEANIP